jgi:hypothetical protein
MHRLARIYVPTVLGIILLSAGVANGQSFLGSIVGTVKDATGGIVPEAQVTLTEVGTGIQRTGKTNADGNYYFSDLSPGTYAVAVSKEGFKEARSTNIVLTAQQTVRFDATIEVGSTTQTIEVKATAPTLNTENAQLGDVRPRADLLNLPLNTRSTLAFFMLSSFNYQGDGSSYSLGGLRSQQTNFTIDGTTSQTALWGGQVGPMIETPLESVREIKLLTSNNSAEFPKVGTVMISSRSGENQFHGSGFFVSSNCAFNARNFFSDTKCKGPTRHEFGGSIGGPVILPGYDGHDKTFFYFTWEQQRFPGGDTIAANVPTLKMRAGDFSDLLPDTQIIDPTNGLPFTDNIIPADRLSPVALKMQDFGFLQPNYGPANSFDANWRGLYYPGVESNNRVVARVDHQLRSTDALSVRVNARFIRLPAPGDADLETIFHRHQQRQTRNAYISETHTFSPTLLNEFRFGYGRDYSTLGGAHKGAQLIDQFGLQGINTANKQDLEGVPSVNFDNFASWWEFPTYYWMSEIYELLDNVTFVKGRHNIKTGVLVRRNRGNITECCDSDFGTLNFDGFATGFDYADFLLGLPHSTNRFERSQPRYNRYTDLGFFVQDDFHVSSRLTLNLGLRYERFQPPVDKYDMRYSFDPSTGNLVLASQASEKLVSPYFPSSIPLVTAQTAGFPSRSLLKSNNTDFGPRIGFAYRLGNSRTVIRGGFGIYYARLSWALMDSFAGGPFHSYEDFTNDIVGGVPRFQFPNPFPGVGEIPSQSISPAWKDLRTPLTEQWNLTVERELPASLVARITYRGFKTTQIPYGGDINKPLPSSDPANADWFRYPNFYQVALAQDGGVQKLNALDVGVERKFTHGLTFQSGWTWAKNLTDVGNDDDMDWIENPYDRRREMADVYWMPRHKFVSSALYELPYGKGKRFGSNIPSALDQVLGNWQISGALLLQTGQFLTPSFSGSDPSNTRTYGGRPDLVGNPNLSSKSIDGWFNPAAFAIPPNGRFGSSGRGVIMGPGINNFDFGLYKYINLGEKAKLQIRMTATNFFNHPNFGNPNTNISSSRVGLIRSLQGRRLDTLGAGPRAIQLGLRIDF